MCNLYERQYPYFTRTGQHVSFAGTVENLIEQEIASAQKKHGEFNSPHEGWAVIREEAIEAGEETGNISKLLDELDSMVRTDAPLVLQNVLAKTIYMRALNGIAELVQVAATCKRYMKMCDSIWPYAIQERKTTHI